VIRIAPFEQLSGGQREAAAEILVRAFAHAPSAWGNLDHARAEVATFLQPPLRNRYRPHRRRVRTALAALDRDVLIGWVGLIRTYSHAFELHPIAVEPDRQRHGVGAALVRALEALAKADGALTIYLGADDDFGGTTLFGADPYPDLLASLARIEASGGQRHPLGFYLRVGFRLAGLIPDANGTGRPDILFAKRIG